MGSGPVEFSDIDTDLENLAFQNLTTVSFNLMIAQS